MKKEIWKKCFWSSPLGSEASKWHETALNKAIWKLRFQMPWGWFFASAAALFAVIFLSFFAYYFSAVDRTADAEQFMVPLGGNALNELPLRLNKEGYIKNVFLFRIFFPGLTGIEPGVYEISKAMNLFEIVKVFKEGADMKWVVVPEGYRKEQIAEILARELDWSDADKNDWINKYTALEYDYVEGVYFPDTYLVPVAESPADVATRMRARFEEKFAHYAKEAARENIKWTTILKIASIIEREAAGSHDAKLISGVLWNRLLAKRGLEIDATLQYIKGNAEIGWWPKVVPKDKLLDSPYNTYKHAGLPPHPICNPGLSAIEAALYPEETECFYYLHDSSGVIYCARTYEEHKKNIETYL